MAQTVADFLEQVERRGFFPSNQSTFTDAEILKIASEELRTKIYPRMIQGNGEFFLAYKDISIVANQDSYEIPEAAYNSVVREVQYIKSNQINDIAQIPVEKTAHYALNLNSGVPSCFYMKADKIVLRPVPSVSEGTLRIYFHASTPVFVEATSAAIITSIDTNNNQVSFSSLPASWVTGDRFDFISKRNGHSYRGIDYTSTTVNSPDIIFSSLPEDLTVGDYVCLTGQSSVIQLPYTMIPVLAQYTAAAVLEYGGQDGWQEAKKKADEMLVDAIATLTPRVQGEASYIMQTWF